MQKIITLIISVIFYFSSFAQQVNVSGSVNDPNENKPVQNAVIALLTVKDSVFYKFTRSDADGKYQFKDVKAGSYIFMTTHPRFADLVEDIEIKTDITLPPYALISKSKILQEV